MARALGIDLGTTHSLAAWVDERGRARLVEMDRGPLLPSAVDYGAGPEPRVGAAALAAAAERPGQVVLSVKRLMGRGPGEAEGRAAAGGEAGALRLDVGGRTVTPVEVSAEILRALRRRAAAALGEPPGACVITVPAYFDDAQRQATRDAGRLAGLEVLRLLPEPTAAALAYGLDRRVRGTFAVYDLGGGTFDLSVLRLEEGLFEVLSTAGDTRLGGDDLDRALAEALLGDAGLPPPAPAGWRALLLAARQARERLSAEPEVALDLVLPGGGRLARRLSRGELERLLAPVVERTGPPCRQALRDAGLAPGALDGVVLVGGATRTPLVRRLVRELFGQEPLTDADPDTAVAQGAALQADALSRGGRPDLLLLDVIPLSLGVEMMGGVVERLVPRNATIPASASAELTTHADGQTGLVVHVVQGERELARDCRSLARFTLRGIPPLPAGAARVRITFAVDADGILSVSAREALTGLAQEIQVRPTTGLSEEEVGRLLAEALEREGEDLRARFLAELRVQADRSLAALAAALAEDGDLLAREEREELDLRVRGLAEAMAGDDAGALQAWLSSLEGAAEPFAERRVARHLDRALRGRHVEEVAGERPPAVPPGPCPGGPRRRAPED
ncbi:MAG: Fe-S protein assembly chaperone HscA [Deltaproteobacteria bacterium]|nr:Fe-S protein assembly chaperone HscA [Deltaproteobacteria bacterium]